MRVIFTILLFISFASGGWARCSGTNLLPQQSPEFLAKLDAAAAKHPFSKGRYFEVTKDGQTSTIVGTIHIDDPETRRLPAPLRQRLIRSRALLVEFDQQAEREMLQEFVQNPTRIYDLEGPSLAQDFSDQEWQTIQGELEKIGFGADLAGRLRPWYLSMILSTPSCAVANRGIDRSLDRMIEKRAIRRDIPVTALEGFDDLAAFFENKPRRDIIKEIKTSLPEIDAGPDMLETTKTLYLSGDIFKILEFSVLRAAEFLSPRELRKFRKEVTDGLLGQRNKNWMPAILSELEQGNAFVAVGALHLGGNQGLLRLLQREGYQVKRLIVK